MKLTGGDFSLADTEGRVRIRRDKHKGENEDPIKID
jgi:hypothetical protein